MIQPVYPPMARQARVQGDVRLTAIIDRTGKVTELKVLEGNPLLIGAARSAVERWRYRPTLLHGQPVEVVTIITVEFRLRSMGDQHGQTFWSRNVTLIRLRTDCNRFTRILAVDGNGPRTSAGIPDRGLPARAHAVHSEECLWFLPRYLSHIPGASRLTRSVDFSRAFFTPPLTPGDAFRLEWEQVAGLELEPMVSLTDHDDIRACDELDSPSSPISVEWTAPYEGSIFHLGIHNLPEAAAQAWMSAMAGYTAKPEEKLLSEILRGLPRFRKC